MSHVQGVGEEALRRVGMGELEWPHQSKQHQQGKRDDDAEETTPPAWEEAISCRECTWFAWTGMSR